MYKMYLDGLGKIGFYRRGVMANGVLYGTMGGTEALTARVAAMLRRQAEEAGDEDFAEPVFTELALEQPSEEQAAALAAREFTHYDKAAAFAAEIMGDGESEAV